MSHVVVDSTLFSDTLQAKRRLIQSVIKSKLAFALPHMIDQYGSNGNALSEQRLQGAQLQDCRSQDGIEWESSMDPEKWRG